MEDLLKVIATNRNYNVIVHDVSGLAANLARRTSEYDNQSADQHENEAAAIACQLLLYLLERNSNLNDIEVEKIRDELNKVRNHLENGEQ